MRKYCFVLALLLGFIVSIPNSYIQASSTRSTENIPTIQDMLDPFHPSGLNLEVVDKRQVMKRKLDIADDISTRIVLLRKHKTKIKSLVEEIQKIKDKYAKEKSKIRFFRAKHKKKKLNEKMQEELKPLENQLTRNRTMSKIQIQAILKNKELALTPEQVARIPPK